MPQNRVIIISDCWKSISKLLNYIDGKANKLIKQLTSLLSLGMTFKCTQVNLEFQCSLPFSCKPYKRNCSSKFSHTPKKKLKKNYFSSFVPLIFQELSCNNFPTHLKILLGMTFNFFIFFYNLFIITSVEGRFELQFSL